ncbi:hypothetical protein BC749_104347 [Flavobacterium araucananum]|uniref:Uncharacterized protein n=1 Tax=Flavobacterium araucananum TaxID=946678 RepID=A0A227PGP0_9FLAO|nr:hypothetical protein [Flavobacterium araucananum]OXG08286.1 hypothetical protein B0A64_05855 [Flavobacterium araucananum]PWJ99189.1 hypothetical protein BC749_104347 [Flavobacterium araucananum]
MDTGTFGFGEKHGLKLSEYSNLFGDPFWGQSGDFKARNIYLQLSEKEKALMLKANYIKMIEKSRERNFNMAADCLQWWLDGNGFPKTIDFHWLRGNNEVIVAENTNIERFENDSDLLIFLNALTERETSTYVTHFDRSFTGGIFRELYYVCGTSTITSTCYFAITKKTNNFVLSGKIIHKWWDRYDWHKGANAYIPSFGYVKDSDALLVEKYCGARPFDMRSEWQQNFNKTFQMDSAGHINLKLK